LIPAGVIGIFH